MKVESKKLVEIRVRSRNQSQKGKTLNENDLNIRHSFPVFRGKSISGFGPLYLKRGNKKNLFRLLPLHSLINTKRLKTQTNVKWIKGRLR